MRDCATSKAGPVLLGRPVRLTAGGGGRRKGKWTNDRAGSVRFRHTGESGSGGRRRKLRVQFRPVVAQPTDVRALLCNNNAAVTSLQSRPSVRNDVHARVPDRRVRRNAEDDLEGRRIFHRLFSGPAFSSFTVDGVRVFLFSYRKQNPRTCTVAHSLKTNATADRSDRAEFKRPGAGRTKGAAAAVTADSLDRHFDRLKRTANCSILVFHLFSMR